MLIIHCPHDPHSRYSHFLVEILRSEGYADLEPTTLSAIDADALARHDLVVLPRCTLEWAQIDLLTNYVANGGVLLACQPDYQLARRFGLEPIFGGSTGGRMTIDTALPALTSLCAEPIDIVTPTLHFRIGEQTNATPLATHTDTGGEYGVIHPALVVQHGEGRALIFAYDLPYAVARLRQGNPENADLGLAYADDSARPNELFVGQLDPAQLHLPQADIHTALLARMIDTLAPRPRLWYYPAPAQPSAVIMTSDEDWSTLEQWQSLIEGLRKRQAQCTFFMVAKSRIEKRWVDEWEQEGHVFSVHPAHPADYNRELPKPPHHRQFMAQMLRDDVERHQEEYQRPVNTIRQHRVRWIGYTECAQIEADLGVAMDCNYLSVKPYFAGYMAGSGRALRFVNAEGGMIPCYQLSAQWTEECLIHEGMSFSLRLPVDTAIARVQQYVREAATRFYTPICFNSHPVSYATYSAPLTDGALDQAVELGVPIVSADAWLAWTQARDGITLQQAGDGYTLTSPHAIDSLTLLLPPGLVAEAAGATTQRVERWGHAYTALTLTNLSAGAQVALTQVVKASA